MNRRFAVVVAALLWLASASVRAQPAPADGAASAASRCAALLAELNTGLQARRPDALIAAAALHESGRCVARDDAKAAQYLGEAAKGGSRLAAMRLARKFGRGWGVPQSYATAGAWIAGKGLSDEPIEAWDYSIGYAGTVLTELLAAVNYPPQGAGQPAELSFVVEIDALHPTRPSFRVTSSPVEAHAALAALIEALLRTRLTEVLTWVAPPERRLLVAARVGVPVTVRYTTATDVATLEGDLLLR